MGNTRKPGYADAWVDVTPLALTRTFLASRLPGGGTICLGLSGGLDSTVLLHILVDLRAELSLNLSAVHVHHGLSPNADTWAAYCRRLCQTAQVPLDIEEVAVVPAGKGIEAAARQARYAVFARRPVDAVLLAHHLDDQVETFFMRLLRGAGARGLSGMAEDVEWRGRRILRPLLDVSRADLEAYARDHGIDPVHDESNLDTHLTRNFLRLEWLPAVEARFPAYRRTVRRTMEHLRESEMLLGQLAREDAGRLDDFQRPEVAAVVALGEARGKNLLRLWLAECLQLTPGSAQLDALWRQVLCSRSDAAVHWHVEGGEVRRYRGRLHALKTGAETPIPKDLPWHGEAALEWGGGRLMIERLPGQGISARLLDGRQCHFQARAGGEHFRPNGLRPGKPVKKWFQESGVPPWERGVLPMLCVDDAPVWIAGLGVDCRYQAVDDEPGWLISWLPHP